MDSSISTPDLDRLFQELHNSVVERAQTETANNLKVSDSGNSGDVHVNQKVSTEDIDRLFLEVQQPVPKPDSYGPSPEAANNPKSKA